MSSLAVVPTPQNEPVRPYAPGSPDRDAVDVELARQVAGPVEIPCVIDGEEVFTDRVVEVRNPCDHAQVLGRVHLARPEDVARAVEGALAARRAWAELPWEERAAVLLRAATLLAGPARARVNAACMLGQGKTIHQAEIDAVCELVDFWRFNPWYAERIYAEQPPVSPPGSWNRLDHRPLDGFVFAVTPFNFASIALNLPTAPALVGNTVVWKPAPTSALAVWQLQQLLTDAGLPPGVIQLVHGTGPDVGDPVLARPELGGVHFTGSTRVFQHMWRTVGEGIAGYRQYPRLVGETGGKDFVLAHPGADPDEVAVALIRGAFEYQGQKCSAASRAYLPRSLWPRIRARLEEAAPELRPGDVRDARTFVGPVIDEAAFERVARYVDLAVAEAEVVIGGTYDRTQGWFVAPTVAVVPTPDHRLMREEIFGPVLAVHVYEDAAWDDTIDLVDRTGPYGLTGAVFADDRRVVADALRRLRHAAGNVYVNDKPTGAVVGQQPFGGSRASGTNDKAGSPLNLLRWISPRAIKETFAPPTDWRYPYQGGPGRR
ncbi:MAG: L-glutamate gamma-semialdehyde dehydrogenase [Alphaproteobacteria bacterium]|nr:L-glutamate gamma-semialdehyde dehydrogenase [Alphaproteobacteria bacterium]